MKLDTPFWVQGVNQHVGVNSSRIKNHWFLNLLIFIFLSENV